MAQRSRSPPGGRADEITGRPGALKQFHAKSCDDAHSRQRLRTLSEGFRLVTLPPAPRRRTLPAQIRLAQQVLRLDSGQADPRQRGSPVRSAQRAPPPDPAYLPGPGGLGIKHRRLFRQASAQACDLLLQPTGSADHLVDAASYLPRRIAAIRLPGRSLSRILLGDAASCLPRRIAAIRLPGRSPSRTLSRCGWLLPFPFRSVPGGRSLRPAGVRCDPSRRCSRSSALPSGPGQRGNRPSDLPETAATPLGMRPVACPPRQAPTVPFPADRPHGLPEPVATSAANPAGCLPLQQALAISIPGRSSPACQGWRSRLPSATRPFTCPPRQVSAPPSRSRQAVPTTCRHPSRLPSATWSGTCHEQVSDLVHRPRDVSPCFVPPRSDAPNVSPLRDFPEVFPRRSLRPFGPSVVETSGPRSSYADRRIFSSHPSDARGRPKVHPAANSPGSAFRPGRGGPAVPLPRAVLASVASDDSADLRASRRRLRPGHPGPSRRTPASQPRRAQGRRPCPSPP